MKLYFFTTILLLLVLCFIPFSGAIAIDDAYCVDIVLVMDCSGSMKRNDPDKLALHGATMIPEMIQSDGCRYGAVMFEGHVTGILPLRDVEDEAAVETIRTELTTIYHQNGRRTDLPRGLYQAVQILLESGEVGNPRVIVALSDGEDDPESGRNMNDVERDRSIVISMAHELNIPIYVIGLNTKGSVAQDTNELIANETGAEAFDIADADQIEPTLTAILEHFRKQPELPELTPTPIPTPAPTAKPTAVPTPSPTAEPIPPVEQKPFDMSLILNLFIIALILGVVVLTVILIRNHIKSGRALFNPYKRANTFSNFFSSLFSGKPYLDKLMTSFDIKVSSLPYGLRFPAAAELRLEHVKTKRSLQQIFVYNWRFANEYQDAFSELSWFLTGTEFYSRKKVEVGITVPVEPGFTVLVDAQAQTKPYKGVIANNRELRITMFRNEDNVYEVILGKSDIGYVDTSWSDSSDIFNQKDIKNTVDSLPDDFEFQ